MYSEINEFSDRDPQQAFCGLLCRGNFDDACAAGRHQLNGHRQDSKRADMSASFSIVVPTNARPYCLERLLRSLPHLGATPQQILVGNSTVGDAPEWILRWYDRLGKIPGVDLITLAPNQSPGSSRKALISKCSAEYIMLLDDDQVVTSSSILLLQTISTSTWDAVGGIWLQNRKPDYGIPMCEHDALLAASRDNLGIPESVVLAIYFRSTAFQVQSSIPP